jgi:ketosteroid isomerase-like protein
MPEMRMKNSTETCPIADAGETGGEMPADGKIATLQAVFDGFNRHDLDTIMSYFADDCVFESPRGPHPSGQTFVGRDEVRKGLAARFERIPDVRYEHDTHFACGEGTTRKGEEIDVRGCDLWTFGNDGNVVRKDSFWKILDDQALIFELLGR